MKTFTTCNIYLQPFLVVVAVVATLIEHGYIVSFIAFAMFCISQVIYFIARIVPLKKQGLPLNSNQEKMQMYLYIILCLCIAGFFYNGFWIACAVLLFLTSWISAISNYLILFTYKAQLEKEAQLKNTNFDFETNTTS